MTATRTGHDLEALLAMLLADPQTVGKVRRLCLALAAAKPVDSATAVWLIQEGAQAGATAEQLASLMDYLMPGAGQL